MNNRQRNAPLIHCVTSPVTMKLVADGIVAVGGRPLMSMEPAEFEEVYRIAQACYLNLGMTTSERFAVMQAAQNAALQAGVPIVLDAVGTALSEVRKTRADTILAAGVSVLHGNVSEVAALLGLPAEGRGVDAGRMSYPPAEIAQRACETFGCMTVVSGAVDAVATQAATAVVEGGSPRLGNAVGMGCLLSGLLAVALTYENRQERVVAMCDWLKRAGEVAQQKDVGEGYFAAEVVSVLGRIYQAECERK